MSEHLPPAVRETVRRLARQERRVDRDERAAALRERREAVLEPHGYTSRVREDSNRDVLVCYPRAWLDGDTVRVDDIESLDRGVELPLSGAGDPEDWTALAARNRDLVADVHDQYGDTHGANAEAFAAFMNNHRAKPIADAIPEDVEEFLAEFYPRNVWPSSAQRAVVEESIELTCELARKK